MRFFSLELPRERLFWIVLAGILMVFVLVFAYRNVGYESRLAGARQYEKALTDTIEQMRDSLQERETLLLLQRKLEPAAKLPTLYDWDIRRLKAGGLQDPIKDLGDDLMKHPELIPYKGTLGGQMGFYSEKYIYVLSPKWVFAHFDDGHVEGCMLLEYQVSAGGKISWRVIDSYLK